MKAALLVIDMQNDYCHPSGKMAKVVKHDISPITKMIPRLNAFIEQAREMKIPIVFTQMTDSANFVPENARRKILELGDIELTKPCTWGYDLLIKPAKGEFVFEKNYPDAMTSKKLVSYLKKNKFDTLIITGVNTHACVDSTVRSAFSLGFNIIVPSDLVACPRKFSQAQKEILKIWQLLFAEVRPSAEVIKELEIT